MSARFFNWAADISTAGFILGPSVFYWDLTWEAAWTSPTCAPNAAPCSQICPAGIELAEKISRLRTQSRRHPFLQICVWGSSLVLQHPGLYRSLTPIWRFLWQYLSPKLTSRWWGEHLALPQPVPRSFFESLPPEVGTTRK